MGNADLPPECDSRLQPHNAAICLRTRATMQCNSSTINPASTKYSAASLQTCSSDVVHAGSHQHLAQEVDRQSADKAMISL